MKRTFFTMTAFVLTFALLAGCEKKHEQTPVTTEATVTTVESEETTIAPQETAIESVETTAEAETPTEAPEETTEEAIPSETEDEGEYEGDASSYHIDVVYAEEIRRYHTAISEQWDANTYLTNEMSPLVADYYDGNALDNVGFSFMDLDNDGMWELIIGAIRGAEENPLVFEVWTRINEEPVMLVQSTPDNRYYLQFAVDDNLWSVANEAEYGAENYGVYYLNLFAGELTVSQGIVYDAGAKEPWFMSYDLDGDVANDMPVDEMTANAILKVGRNTYISAEYFPYSLYK